jgi:hypothetical protein
VHLTLPAHLLTRRLTSPLFHVSLFFHSTKDFTAVQRDDGVTIQVKTEFLWWIMYLCLEKPYFASEHSPL